MATIGFRTLFDTVRGVLSFLAGRTATQLDDNIVALLGAIADSPVLLDWLESKFNAQQEGVLSIESEPTEAIALELGKRGIDWSKLVALLPVIVELFGKFAG